MKKSNILSIAMGSVLATSALGTAVAAQVENPFGAVVLEQGYQLAQNDKKADGKCGEGKCGSTATEEKHDKKSDGKCGGDKEDKKAEAKCGAKH